MATSPQSPSHPGKFAEVLEAHVVGFCKKTHTKRKKQYAVYTIDVSFAAAQWKVYRRFSEFVKFNSSINRAFPALRFLSIPSRLQKSLDTSFLEKRRQKLNSFVIDVLDQVPLMTPILKCEPVMQFLEVMKNLEKHFALDKRTKGREFFPDLYASFPFNKKTIHLTIQHGMDKGEDIPIHIAAKEGNCEGVSALIKAEPDIIYSTDFLGQTALHVSSRHGQAPVVRLLLIHGADKNIQDKRGWSPLHCACTSADLQSVLTLLEDESIIPDLQNVDGNTPLHYFVRNFTSSPPDMLKDVLAIFTKKGVDLNVQNKSGETPLHHACWKGSFPLVASLLASGANPNVFTHTEESPVQWAVREGRSNIAHFLIQNGAKTDKSLFDAALPPPVPEVEIVDRNVEDGYDEDDYDDDDGSDDSDDESSGSPKSGRSKLKLSGSSSSSPSSTPPSLAFSNLSSNVSSPPSNLSSPPSHVSSLPSNVSSLPSNLSSLSSPASNLSALSSPPSSLSTSSISPPSSLSTSNISPPNDAAPKFVLGTHHRNNQPGTFLPVLASPKRLLRPTDHEVHQIQIQQQLLQLAQYSHPSHSSQISQPSQIAQPPQSSQPSHLSLSPQSPQFSLSPQAPQPSQPIQSSQPSQLSLSPQSPPSQLSLSPQSSQYPDPSPPANMQVTSTQATSTQATSAQATDGIVTEHANTIAAHAQHAETSPLLSSSVPSPPHTRAHGRPRASAKSFYSTNSSSATSPTNALSPVLLPSSFSPLSSAPLSFGNTQALQKLDESPELRPNSTNPLIAENSSPYATEVTAHLHIQEKVAETSNVPQTEVAESSSCKASTETPATQNSQVVILNSTENANSNSGLTQLEDATASLQLQTPVQQNSQNNTIDVTSNVS